MTLLFLLFHSKRSDTRKSRTVKANPAPSRLRSLKNQATTRSYLQFSIGQYRTGPDFLDIFSSRIGEPHFGQGWFTGLSQAVNLHSG